MTASLIIKYAIELAAVCCWPWHQGPPRCAGQGGPSSSRPWPWPRRGGAAVQLHRHHRRCCGLDLILLGNPDRRILGVVLVGVPMTSMPETAVLFNGCGGIRPCWWPCGSLYLGTQSTGFVALVSIVVSKPLAITFTGSIVVMAKPGVLSTPAWMQARTTGSTPPTDSDRSGACRRWPASQAVPLVIGSRLGVGVTADRRGHAR